MFSKHSSSPRRTHRKRASALHLSSDTTATLPEYYQASAAIHSWQRHTQDSSIEQDIPSDKPPDYPDSAEEADEDTDSENHRNPFFVQHFPTGTSGLPRTPHTAATSSPRRKQRFQHKRKYSVTTPSLGYSETSPVDPYLDALLERSVHALEISNTLLKSSMTTQTSLSTVLAYDSPVDQNLQSRAVSLSSRIKGSSSQASWVDDMEEIRQKVDSLFGDGTDLEDGVGDKGTGHEIRSKADWRRRLHSPNSSGSEAGISCSLPVSVSPLQQRRPQRRRPSLDLREAAAAETSEAGRLRLSHRTRDDLVARPPRALTQYIESGADPAFITLPPTLGIRSAASIYPSADWNGSTTSLHSSPALPVVTETPLPSSSTPAYTKLASFIIKRPSNSANATPSSSFTSSFMITRRNSSAGSSERGRRTPQPSPRRSFEVTRSHTIASPASPLPSSHLHRPMTPTAEESSSSDGCVAKQTISSLRKILDEQPTPDDTGSLASSNATKKAVAPMQLTPPVPVSGTSTATASISRMLTKKVHHSSTRPPSPPRLSAMKGSRPATPSSTSMGDVVVVPERPSSGIKRLISRPNSKGQPQSASSSGRSTPKRISFAELPEAHISSRPEKFRDKGNRKGKSKAKMRGGSSEESEDGGGSGWFAALFGLNPNAGLAYASRQEERMEDRISRSWGGRGGGGGSYGYMDEWAV